MSHSIEAHRDEIDALSLFYSRPYGARHLTLEQIKELAEALEAPPVRLTPERLWDAYAALERDKVRWSATRCAGVRQGALECDKVRGAGEERLLTDIVQLVRHALGEADELAPYREEVERRYHEWLAIQERAGRTFTPEQLDWLALIRDHVAVNLNVRMGDLWKGDFAERGGPFTAAALFGKDELAELLSEINDALAA